MTGNTDTEAAAEALARAAGLEKAWAEHRADVLEAIEAARKLRGSFARPADPAAEPTPAYRAPMREGAR
jgi:hypothetical protein